MTYFLMLTVYIVSTIYFCTGLSLFGLTLTERYNKKIHVQHTMILSAVNLLVCTLCGILHFGLFVNWAIFAVINYMEARYLLRIQKRLSIFFSLSICLVGLSGNLFYRAFLTILLDQPLSYFDHAARSGNVSATYPVILTFFSCGTIFFACVTKKLAKRLRYVLRALYHLRFLLVTMAILLGYLMAQVLLYTSQENMLSTKIWSLVSCLYVSFGYLCILAFALKMSYLYHLEQENKVMQSKLHTFMSEEQNLRRFTDLDATTGVYSRGVGDDLFLKFIQEYPCFQVSLIDLDGLKYVNDHYGHEAGDRYLKKVAEFLKNICVKGRDFVYRYGGDEFILLYLDKDRSVLAEQLRVCGSKLQKQQETYGMQISFGIVTYQGEETVEELIETADRRMYEMKRRHKKEMPERFR